MDKKSIIGLILIFGIFVGYMWWVSPSKEEMAERQRVHDSLVQVYDDSVRVADSLAALQASSDSLAASGDSSALQEQKADLGIFNAAAQGESSLIAISNERMSIQLNTQGAMVNQVMLKDYLTYDSNDLIIITPADDNMNLVFSTEDNRVINTKDLVFKPYIGSTPWNGEALSVEGDDSVCVNMRAEVKDSLADGYLEFAYTVHGNSYEVDFNITFNGLSKVVRNTNYLDLVWKNRMNRQEKVSSSDRGKGTRNSDRERFYSSIYHKSPSEKSVDHLSTGRDDKDQVKTNLEWIAFKQQYFAAILNANGTPFQNADLEVSTDKSDTARNYLTDMKATIGLPYSPANQTLRLGFYFGPTKYRDLSAMDRGYEKMLPLGWTVISKSVSRWLIIPTFNLFENFILNYGIIVIVFTLLLRLVLFPLTFKSYQGSAIMRILKPEMDALNKKFPQPEQAMQKQQQMMALQKKAGYSPMAGCLPILLQMPVWTAMFMFYPIAIELRQKPFLWCDDLSTYDSILDFGFNIPLYGDHVSLFCLLMFVVQFFYTWYTMKSQQMQASMPGMKYMMYFMPFMLLFIFNSQSAALCLYQFISISFTMVSMILIRRFTSEKKVRARMEAYDRKHAAGKGKPAKKSKFAKRLEEMQKMAEQMQKEKNKR